MADQEAQGRVAHDLLSIQRDSHFFATRGGQVENLRSESRVIGLVADQLFQPLVPGDYVLRLGKVRASEFLPDGREVTRAVLLAGSTLSTRQAAEASEDPGQDIYSLAQMVLMALGDVEIWQLPPDTLASPD